jgi:hypothetical protein
MRGFLGLVRPRSDVILILHGYSLLWVHCVVSYIIWMRLFVSIMYTVKVAIQRVFNGRVFDELYEGV